MVNIKKIVIDFDCTAFNTVKAITSLYNEDFSYYTDFEPVYWGNVKTWNFEELKCAPEKYIDHYFNQPRFFRELEEMDSFFGVSSILFDKCDIAFCTMGYTPNLRYKSIYLKERFPNFGFIGVNIKEHKDKSHIDMTDCIFIDDSVSNLKTSNAPIKILFGPKYDWNYEWDGIRCQTWDEVLNVICDMENNNKINFR